MARRRTRIENRHDCGDGRNAVVTVISEGDGTYLFRRKPCEECPWRKDSPVGAFPAEAYRKSAITAYDMSMHTFGCHMSTSKVPATCAGFILSNSKNNLHVRTSFLTGKFDYREVSDAGVELYKSYREMAIANGVAPDDPVLSQCRDDDE